MQWRAPSQPNSSSTTIPYQGRLAGADSIPLSGKHSITFSLYNTSAGGTALWTESWTGQNAVKVSNGLFNVLLGSLTPIPSGVFTIYSTLWIGISVDTDSEMTPRIQVGSAPMAMQSIHSDTATVADYALEADTLDGLHATDVVPVGTVIAFAGPTIPDGWMLCDGRTLNRAEYSALFTAISIWFGEGNASTTFQIPDCTANTIIGSGGAPWRTNRTLGQFGGAEAHTITMDDLPVHDTAVLNNLSTAYAGYQFPTYRRVSNPISLMPPFIVMNYIIKYR